MCLYKMYVATSKTEICIKLKCIFLFRHACLVGDFHDSLRLLSIFSISLLSDKSNPSNQWPMGFKKYIEPGVKPSVSKSQNEMKEGCTIS